MSEAPLIATKSGLDAVISALLNEPTYALDTEFHREKTYFPKLALVQIAWADQLVLIDPLAVDLRPFSAVLESDAVAVLHAADQDLEILELTCGTIPKRLFDTQIAAGFLGLSTPSLASLYDKYMGVRLGKGDRLTDWLQRPLTDAQIAYAANDVVHLLELRHRIETELDQRGRLQWAAEECEIYRTRSRGQRNPEEAWRRIKEARQLKGQARSVARSVAAWRERRAASLDIPVRHVLSDIALSGVAQRLPRDRQDLEKIRGFDRSLREEAIKELLAAVAVGLSDTTPAGDDSSPAVLDRDLRPAVALISAWVAQLSRDLEIDPSILATRGDIEAFLRDDPDCRLSHGWRSELAGDPVRSLLNGGAAVAFSGEGELVIEQRSHQPFVSDPKVPKLV